MYGRECAIAGDNYSDKSELRVESKGNGRNGRTVGGNGDDSWAAGVFRT